MPEYLKQAPWYSAQVSEQVRATVAEMLSQVPQGRLGTVEEAASVVFAASPAAGMVTGTSIVLDGGWTAR